MSVLFNGIDLNTGSFYGVTTNKGEILVNDGTKNTSLSIGTNDYVLTADSTQTTGLKWAPVASSGNIGQKILSANVSTNSTTAIIISDLSFTPPITSTYLIMYNFTYAISRSNQTLSVAIYKNGTVISDTVRTLQSAGSTIISNFNMSYSASLLNTDAITIRFYVSNTNTVGTIYSSNLNYIYFT